MSILSRGASEEITLQQSLAEAMDLSQQALESSGFTHILRLNDQARISAKFRTRRVWGSVMLDFTALSAIETSVAIESSAKIDNVFAITNDPNQAIISALKSGLNLAPTSNEVTPSIISPDAATGRTSSVLTQGGGGHTKFLWPSLGVLFVVAVIATRGAFATPSESEIMPSQYEEQCDRREYDDNCKGKFIKWEGAVRNIKPNYLRVSFDNGTTMDVQGLDGNRIGLAEGQKVRVAGWLADRNFAHPDIENGEVLPLETLAALENRVAEEKAKNLAEYAAWEAKADRQIAMCSMQSYGDTAATRACLSERVEKGYMD